MSQTETWLRLKKLSKVAEHIEYHTTVATRKSFDFCYPRKAGMGKEFGYPHADLEDIVNTGIEC